MRAFDSPGVWLYSKKPSAPLKMKTKDGRLVEWDPDFKLGLIVTFWNDNSCGANGAPAENKYALKLHFGGSKHLIDGSNVICQHSEKSRTDVRFKARCYLRVCVPKSVADLSSPAKKIQEITRGESDLQVASPSRLQKHENSVGDVQSNVLSSRSAGESAAQDIIGLLPMTEIQRRLHRHDRGAKKEFLRHLSYFITNALSQNEESSDEECDRSLGQGEDDEITANPHHKRARNKGTGGVRNLSGAHEALLLRCLQLASEFEDDISDNESKRDFKCVNDEIERIRSTHDSRTDDAFEVASSIQIQPSEHLYGGMEPEVRLEEANLKLYDDYDFCVSKMRSLHVEEDDGTSVTIDSQYVNLVAFAYDAFSCFSLQLYSLLFALDRSWEEFKERFAAAKIDIGETGKPKISSLESNLANKQGSTALLIAFVDKVKETVKSINIVDKSPAVIQGKAADAAVSNPFSKVTNEVQKGLKDTSDNIAWGSAQAQYNIASIAGKAGPPIKPYLSLKEEQKARMTALFKAVDPNKLEIIDKLVEKRGQLKGVIGFRKDGFDQMWKSYKQRWGAEAIKKAFDKVEEKKKMFYRLKTLALFAAADLPMDGPEIDVLMEKYSGKYDDMYKFWVTTKKFDAYAIAAAHANALKNIER